jgi:hypothetical protein
MRRLARDTTKRDTTKRDTTGRAASPARTAARRPATTPAKDTVPPDFTIELEDGRGRVARLPLSAFGAVRMPIESYIYRRRGRDKAQFPTLAEPVMQTYLVPMSAFVGQAAEFDPATIRAIRLVFDRKRVGAILLDDLGVTGIR